MRRMGLGRYGRSMRAVLVCLFLALNAQAAWKRLVVSPKGEHSDSPGAHPLSYFTQYPPLHDASGDFCYLCSPEKRLREARRAKVRADVRRLGTVAGRAVLDVHFTASGEERASWKSLLVQYSAGRYFEIYQVWPNLGTVLPSYVFSVSKDRIVATKDDCQRYGCTEQFFWVGRDGPVHLDFGPVFRAAEAACPKGAGVWRDLGTVNRTLPRGFIRLGTLDPEFGKPSNAAEVIVPVKLVDGRFVISQARYVPDTGANDPTRKQ